MINRKELALKHVDPNAKTVDLSGCTNLSEVPAFPNAEYVDLSGCTNLSEVPAFPNAKTVYLSGCTNLSLAEYQRPGGRMYQFLEGGGKTVNEIVAAGAWDCHDWSNCPTHCAYGASSIDDVPAEWQAEAVRFIGLFDANLLGCPVIHRTTEEA